MDLYWKENGFLIIHNNCIFPYHGYSIEIVWIYYGFSGAIAMDFTFSPSGLEWFTLKYKRTLLRNF
jgi:hypothetical protein